MFTNKLVLTVLVLLMITAAAGCTTYSSWEGQTEMNRNWGKSYAMAKDQQILNPDAGKNQEPVEGLEGQVGDGVMKGYINKDAGNGSSSQIGSSIVTTK